MFGMKTFLLAVAVAGLAPIYSEPVTTDNIVAVREVGLTRNERAAQRRLKKERAMENRRSNWRSFSTIGCAIVAFGIVVVTVILIAITCSQKSKGR